VSLPSIAHEDLYLWGWYLAEDFSGALLRPATKFYNNNGDLSTTLYARWEEEQYADALSYNTAIPLTLGTYQTVTFTGTQ
jgi:hypothetical protein